MTASGPFRLPTPYSRLPIPYSRLPTPYSRLPTPYSRLPTPYMDLTPSVITSSTLIVSWVKNGSPYRTRIRLP